MRRTKLTERPISSSQYRLLLQASTAPHGRIYQADIGGGGSTASAWHRSCRVLVARGLMVDVSSNGVYQITERGVAFIGSRARPWEGQRPVSRKRCNLCDDLPGGQCPACAVVAS